MVIVAAAGLVWLLSCGWVQHIVQHEGSRTTVQTPTVMNLAVNP